MEHTDTSTETAVLAHLAGSPLEQAAREHHLPVPALKDLVHRYTAAGRAALHAAPSRWQQVNVEFTDHARSEDIATAWLLPVLAQARADTDVAWWFMRKPPGWRVRILPPPSSPSADPIGAFALALDVGRSAGFVRRWWCAPYEPETTAFGGPSGMDLSHDLFAADSTGIAHLLMRKPFGEQAPDRRLLSLLLMTHLQRAAGLDPAERGDVWAKVAAQRPVPELPATTRDAVTTKAWTVLTTDTTTLTQAGNLLQPVARWAQNLADVGTRLGAAADNGLLTCGVRALLARHVIFHWNRLGIGAAQQSVWASAARDALLTDKEEQSGPRTTL